MRNIHIREMAYISVFIVLIAIGAKIVIPVPVCPFTLQLLFTTLAGLVLGGRLGALSVLCYILLGLIGVPVFASGGGPGYILEPTFGYLPGFALGAYAAGTIAGGGSGITTLRRILAANFTGLFIVYIIGILYFWLITVVYIGNPLGFGTLILYCFVLAVPGDISLCIMAAFVYKKLIALHALPLQH